MPAASVGVKMPPRMPPMMTTGISKAGKARTAPTSTSLPLALASRG